MLCIYMIGITSYQFNEAMTICLLPGVIVDIYSFINASIKCWLWMIPFALINYCSD